MGGARGEEELLFDGDVHAVVVPQEAERGKSWFIDLQTPPPHASEEDETRRQGSHRSHRIYHIHLRNSGV